jgi:sulfite exporter TauE/SafE
MLASQSIFSTSVGMLCFGLGTMPALIFSSRLMGLLGSIFFKRFSSLFLMAFGVWTLLSVLYPEFFSVLVQLLNLVLGTNLGMEHHHH